MTKELQICSYRNDVERYLSKKYPSARKEDIEDVVQSAIIKASICQSQWRGETTLKSWLTKIAINIHNDMHRKSYFKNESLIYSEDTNSVFENIIEKDFSETLCENNYLTSLYDELMLGLEDNISIITFNLRVIDDIDYKDIAIKQNISIAAVKSRIHRGKMMLQKKYREISYKYEETTV
jgi:RNA polymerase sigma-70 factor (ECF subfamily)